MADTVTYTYYIKKTSEQDSSYVNKESNTNANYTFIELEQGTSYDIKVEALGDKAGNKGEGTLSSQSTVSIPGGETGLEEGAIAFGVPTWSGGTASVVVSTNTTEYTIEYQISAGEPVEENWTTIENNGTVSGINYGDTVYARLTDGTNYGEYASATITDTTGPSVEIVQGEVTYNSIAVTVNATDGESGLAESDTYKYYLNEEAEARETSTSNTYTFTGLTAETHYTIKVEVYDEAGNVGLQTTEIDTEELPLLQETTTIEDASGDEVTIPGGFMIADDSPADADDGIVITDGTNEFVWIPVSSAQLAEMYTEAPGTALSSYTGVDATTNVYGNLKSDSDGSSGFGGLPGSTACREPDILIDNNYPSSGDSSTESERGINLIKSVFGYEGSNAEVLDQFADMIVANYEEAYKSIKEYGGFYIGRYELTGSVDSPTVQKGQTVIINQNWYNFYKACSNVVNTEFAKSTMIAGTQYDRALEWLVDTGDKSSSDVYSDSSSWGNYSDSTGEAATGSGELRTSGYNEAWQANNIYDLAGNCYEWTQEANGINYRVNRGGNYETLGSTLFFPASKRNYGMTYITTNFHSSRAALYIVPSITVADLVGGEKFTDTTTVQDDIGNDVVIPGGFGIAEDSGTKVEDGIVIEDSEGNQFVWIPTGTYQTSDGEKTNELTRRQWATTADTVQEPTPITGDGAIDVEYYGEGDNRSVAYDSINNFINSAKPVSEGGHGGFYIGRYEQGEGNVCKAGMDVYQSYISMSGAKEAAESMYSGKSEIKATCELINSYAWDTALNYICQNSEYGYELATTTSSDRANIGRIMSGPTQTGGYAADCYSNIYDFLGNYCEWTTEYSSHMSGTNNQSCVYRGGYSRSRDYYAAIRDSAASLGYSYVSFRVSMYI